MRANSLLRQALTYHPDEVLDIGVGRGDHAIAFIANGAKVVGVDLRPANIEHKHYEHHQDPYEELELDKQFDMVWCSHTLEHIPNVQNFLLKLRGWLKPEGFLCMAVPTDRQRRFHISHLTLWTPAHLAYNLICAGWDCSDAIWYTEYLTIGLIIQKTDDLDLDWRTAMPDEQHFINQFMPIEVSHEDGAWWGNNWPEELDTGRVSDPPLVTIGASQTNLKPEIQLAYGPNPKLRKDKGTWEFLKNEKAKSTTTSLKVI